MKNSNKLLYVSICAFVVAAFLLASRFIDAKNPKENPNTFKGTEVSDSGESIYTERNISDSVDREAKKLYYRIKIEDDKICAYMECTGQNPVLWNTAKIPIGLPGEERERLEAGIVTDSFEELCLYFEAYAS